MNVSARLPYPLYTANETRALDRIAMEEFGIAGSVLMSRAGAAAFETIQQCWPDAQRLVIVCGVGNNAGDGFVVARLAHREGLSVSVALLDDSARLKGDARTAYQQMVDAGLSELRFEPQMLEAADLIVDAMFGTGLMRDIVGEWADAIAAINARDTPVLAIDIPSGLHADTGRVLGVGVRADATISFIGLKRGMFTGRGRDQCGRILFDDLQVPESLYGVIAPGAVREDLDGVKGALSPRQPSSHKGSFGHVLVIGGERGFAGAPRLAGEAAARVGAGLVSIATRTAHVPVIGVARPELMCHGVESPDDLEPLLERATVIAIGPGLGQLGWGRALLSAVVESPRPLVVDADALNLLADLEHRRQDWILTPHPGEAARLLGKSTGDIQGDRFAALYELVTRFGGVGVLKGVGTLVCAEDRVVGVCTDGNPGMATGGTGDVLTGVIAGLAAQGLPLLQAARLGACVHARAGDLAARRGQRGLLAGDLMEHLRGLVNPPLS